MLTIFKTRFDQTQLYKLHIKVISVLFHTFDMYIIPSNIVGKQLFELKNTECLYNLILNILVCFSLSKLVF